MTEPGEGARAAVMAVAPERRAQEAQWGVHRHSWPEWMLILTEGVAEASRGNIEQHWRSCADFGRLRSGIVRVAAVAVAMIGQNDALAESDGVA